MAHPVLNPHGLSDLWTQSQAMMLMLMHVCLNTKTCSVIGQACYCMPSSMRE